jgi:hypothetical protein
MYEILSQLCCLKPMLKFSVQTFYQHLFSIFPSTILFPSAIVPFSFYHFSFNNSFQQFFPSIILFPSKSFPHQKAQSKAPKKQKAKAPLPASGVFYSSKQGGAMGRGCDIVTGETCSSASRNTI